MTGSKRKGGTTPRNGRRARDVEQRTTNSRQAPSATNGKEPAPPGRLSEYLMEYCELSVTHARAWAHLADFAAKIGVAPSHLSEWADDTAYKIAAWNALKVALEKNLRPTTNKAEADKAMELLDVLWPADSRGVRLVAVGETP